MHRTEAEFEAALERLQAGGALDAREVELTAARLNALLFALRDSETGQTRLSRADFGGAVFLDDIEFGRVVFKEEARFSEARFRGKVGFRGARFLGCSGSFGGEFIVVGG